MGEELQGTRVLNISGDQKVDPTNSEVRTTRRDEKRGKNNKVVEMLTFFRRVVAAPIAETTSKREATKLQSRPRF